MLLGGGKKSLPPRLCKKGLIPHSKNHNTDLKVLYTIAIEGNFSNVKFLIIREIAKHHFLPLYLY